MDTSSLRPLFTKFLESDRYKSILIDGPWGCGKTYQIKEILKENKKPVTYISLFGLETIDEINTLIYKNAHKVKENLKNASLVISKATNAIPYVGSSISESLEAGIECFGKNKIVRKRLIVFDDLERKSDKIQYCDLLGYINKLFSFNCKIMCLVSSSNITDVKQKNCFSDFKEKIFDNCYVINETNLPALKAIIEDDELAQDEDIQKALNNNLRTALRAKTLYDEVLEHLNNNSLTIETIQLSNRLLYKACIYSVNICLQDVKNSIDNKIKESFSYLYLVEKYNEELVHRYYSYLDKSPQLKEDVENAKFREILFALIYKYLLMDDCKLLELFDDKNKTKVIDDETDILNKEFYFLSDENKMEYCKKLNDCINKNEFELSDKFQQKIASLISYAPQLIKKKGIENISKSFVNWQIDYQYSTLQACLNDSGCNNDEIIKEIIKKIESNIIKLKQSSFFDECKKVFASNDFKAMTDFLYEYKSKSDYRKEIIIQYLEKNKYFMPDITKDIEYGNWSYCHELAKFVYSAKREKQFILFAHAECIANKDNKSLIDRYHALIKFNIDRNYNKADLIKTN